MRGKKNPVELPKLRGESSDVLKKLSALPFDQADAVVAHYRENKTKLRYQRMKVQSIINSLPPEEAAELFRSALEAVINQ